MLVGLNSEPYPRGLVKFALMAVPRLNLCHLSTLALWFAALCDSSNLNSDTDGCSHELSMAARMCATRSMGKVVTILSCIDSEYVVDLSKLTKIVIRFCNWGESAAIEIVS